MGWTYTRRRRGQSHLSFFREVIGPNVVVAAARGHTEVYLAVQANEAVVGVVCHIRWVPRDPLYNFGWKDVDETMGPVSDRCPASILDMLSPIEVLPASDQGREWARAWRERCRVWQARQAERLPLSKGLRFQTPDPLRFTDGRCHQKFLVVNPRRLLVRPLYEDGTSGHGLLKLDREALVGAVAI